MRKKKQEKVNPIEIEIALSSVLQPRFSRITNDTVPELPLWKLLLSRKC